uniref:Uncharacterized protein n=1 Tax=Arundo donax TaxID=35708 RepID=A0A0A8Z499_ARUDO
MHSIDKNRIRIAFPDPIGDLARQTSQDNPQSSMTEVPTGS